ncbi:MAG: dihydrolipoamide succinyltransferase, partial [Xanthomonadales bacterium]|nr:dihydrolipoamide succinyltransferase [Xanthomonadales bacterium]
MSTEIKVPVLPESVADATVALWHKKPGDSIRRDENLVDLETDKVVLEVPSPVDGVVTKITRDSGETVTSGELLGMIEEGAVEAVPEPTETAPKADSVESTPEADADTAKLSP